MKPLKEEVSMKKRLIVLTMVLALIAAPLAVFAQEPGSGGPIIEGNGGTSVGALNYLSCAGTDCRNVARWLVVGFLGTDPEVQDIAPGLRDGVLATDWTVSDDNLVYTFSLRDDLVWSDGEPVDGWDVLFDYYGRKHSDEYGSPYAYTVDDIVDLEVSEDGYTVTITFGSENCEVIYDAALNLVPSHAFGWTPEMGEDFDWSSLENHPYDTNPNVSGGPFVFRSMDSDRVVLGTNENYVDGPVIPEGYLYVTVPDQTVMAERFIAGELNVADNPQNAKRQEIRESPDLQYYDYPSRSWDYLDLNFANPDNPMDGVELDADGNPVLGEDGLPIPVEQDPHPLFGDVRVRRAIQLAIDLDEIMDKAVQGEGTVMPSYDFSWAADPDLEPIRQDQAAAVALLEEAGWTDTNGDGILDKDGVDFSFELLTNEGNTRRGQIAELVQQQLAEIGIEVQVSAIDFNQLLDISAAQTYDAIVLGWRWGYPVSPDPTGIFLPSDDIVGSGFNSMSYINPEVARLAKEALNVPGCAKEDRAKIYAQIQKILQDDEAYIWLFRQGGMYAANADVAGFAPFPNEMYWNADEWTITQ
jgi:peptide/nickel transport system substrate-binding protein